jgi:mannose PTS system EIID component
MVNRTEARLLLRSFLVQAAWNHRTLLGVGTAWALAPELEDERALARHAEAFNTHPYLATVALGALARMERDGEDPERIRKFRSALRAPLGSLGDALVWAGWLPGALLVAGISVLLGASPGAAAIVFLALHNAMHLSLRAWGVRVGFRDGIEVGGALARVRLDRMGTRAREGALLLSGVFMGLLGAMGAAYLDRRLAWALGALAILGVGLWRGRRLPGGSAGWLALLLLAGGALVVTIETGASR